MREHLSRTRSSIMIEALCNAYNAVNHPTKDEIFQVTVRRGIPADTLCTVRRDVLNGISVGGKAKKYVDMSEDELAAAGSKELGATSGACRENDFRSTAFVYAGGGWRQNHRRDGSVTS